MLRQQPACRPSTSWRPAPVRAAWREQISSLLRAPIFLSSFCLWWLREKDLRVERQPWTLSRETARGAHRHSADLQRQPARQLGQGGAHALEVGQEHDGEAAVGLHVEQCAHARLPAMMPDLAPATPGADEPSQAVAGLVPV